VLLLLLQAPLSATTTNGLPSLSVTLTDITSKVTQVADNDGHPELAEFVKQRTAGPATLQISFVPNAQGDGMDASNFVIASGVELFGCTTLRVRDAAPACHVRSASMHAEEGQPTCHESFLNSYLMSTHHRRRWAEAPGHICKSWAARRPAEDILLTGPHSTAAVKLGYLYRSIECSIRRVSRKGFCFACEDHADCRGMLPLSLDTVGC
jgi:hypothetical protein